MPDASNPWMVLLCPVHYIPSALFVGSILLLQHTKAKAKSKSGKSSSQSDKFDVKTIARANILALEPYRCARDDYSNGVLLDANENAFGPGLNAKSEEKKMDLHRYPDPLHLDIKAKFCKFRGGVVNPHQVFFGVGSDEAIDILFRVFCTPTVDNVLICPPTYGMYKVCAAINDVEVLKAPLTTQFEVDIKATLAAINSNTKMVFLCSPGNPTSRVIPNSVVEEVLKYYTWGCVIVDEAYIDFSGTESACCLVAKYPNVVVLQTLSKAFGLAGIRLGMAIAQEPIITLMNNMKAPYNINKLTADVTDRALSDLSQYKQNVEGLLKEKEELLKELKKYAAVEKIFPSDCNFILFRIAKSKEIYKMMADRGVVCRYRGSELHCTECLRVTVGTKQENQAFIKLLKECASELGVF